MTRTRRGRRPPPPEPGCLPVFRGVPSRPAPPIVGPPRPPASPVHQRSPGRSGPRGRLPLLPTARAAPRVIANLESPLADLNEVSGSFRVWKKGGCPRAPALGEGGSWLPDSLLLMFTMGSSKSPAQQSEVLRGDVCTWGPRRGWPWHAVPGLGRMSITAGLGAAFVFAVALGENTGKTLSFPRRCCRCVSPGGNARSSPRFLTAD